jgi:hypothetical protein
MVLHINRYLLNSSIHSAGDNWNIGPHNYAEINYKWNEAMASNE